MCCLSVPASMLLIWFIRVLYSFCCSTRDAEVLAGLEQAGTGVKVTRVGDHAAQKRWIQI